MHIIGVSGGSGSGKTTFSKALVREIEFHLGHNACSILYQDSYYIDQSAVFKGDGENVNFDHPDSLEFSLMARHLIDLKNGLTIEVPIYDFVTHKRLLKTQSLTPPKVLIVDGTLIYSQENLFPLIDTRVFINTSENLRYERRLRRDTIERGRTADGVFKQFYRQVKPMHDLFVEPSQKNATHIVSGMHDVRDALASFIEHLRILFQVKE